MEKTTAKRITLVVYLGSIFLLLGTVQYLQATRVEQLETIEQLNAELHAVREYNKISETVYQEREQVLAGQLREWSVKSTPNRLLWPITEECYVTSPFGRRDDPFQGPDSIGGLTLYGGRTWGLHTGVDISSRAWHPEIQSPVEGTVTEHYVPPRKGTKWKGHKIYGGMVEVTTPDGTRWIFAHLSETFVHEGEQIKIGQSLGRMGGTGQVTGEHLHIETILVDGERVNPLDLLDYELITPRGVVVRREK